MGTNYIVWTCSLAAVELQNSISSKHLLYFQQFILTEFSPTIANLRKIPGLTSLKSATRDGSKAVPLLCMTYRIAGTGGAGGAGKLTDEDTDFWVTSSIAEFETAQAKSVAELKKNLEYLRH